MATKGLIKKFFGSGLVTNGSIHALPLNRAKHELLNMPGTLIVSAIDLKNANSTMINIVIMMQMF
jgi:hypothetical protein